MNLDPNISFFQFSCEETRKTDIIFYLSNIPELECEYFSNECFSIPGDKKNLPTYLKKISKELLGVEFVHTYSFPLANTMGYSIFKNGELIYQHRECLTDRITKVRLQEFNINGDSLCFEFIYEHFEYPLDFDSKSIPKKIHAKLLIKDFKKFKDINFQTNLKFILKFNSDELLEKQINEIVIDKIYTTLNPHEIQTKINYLSLEQKLKQKFEKNTIKKL